MKNTFVQFVLMVLISIAGPSANCSQQHSDNPGYSGQNIDVQTASVIEDVEPKKFKELISMQEGTILDVRTPKEVAKGYIENAKTINIYDKDFEQQVNLLQKDKPVFVYCRSGHRSAKAAKILKKRGFGKVYNLLGGIIAWNDKGFEVVKP